MKKPLSLKEQPDRSTDAGPSQTGAASQGSADKHVIPEQRRTVTAWRVQSDREDASKRKKFMGMGCLIFVLFFAAAGGAVAYGICRLSSNI